MQNLSDFVQFHFLILTVILQAIGVLLESPCLYLDLKVLSLFFLSHSFRVSDLIVTSFIQFKLTFVESESLRI